MINLVINESRKLIFRRSFIVYLIIIFGLVALVGGINKYAYSLNSNEYFEQKAGDEGEPVKKTIKKGIPVFTYSEDGKPVTTLEEAVKIRRSNLLAAQAKEKEDYPNEIAYAQKELDYYEAYLKKGVTPITTNNGGESAGSFFSSLGGILSIVNMLVVVVASMMVASEFSDGTIKLLLTRPHKRSQILLSKLIVCLLFAAFVTLFTMVAAGIVGAILFPVQSFMLPASTMLGTMSALKAGFVLAGTNYLLMVLYISVALMISAVFRSQALAVGIAMLMVFSSSIINTFLSLLIPKWEPLKWIVFNLLNINELGRGNSIPGDISLVAAGIGLLLYSILIYMLTVYLFKKRDVALT